MKQKEQTISVKIDILESSFGQSLYINDHRVSGAKPYGGGNVVKTFRATRESIIDAISEVVKDAISNYEKQTNHV
jgi:hypothetical protein